MRPEVSIVVAAHDVAGYVDECLGSALGQTLADFELLVVDDASTDATAERLRRFDDPRIRVLRNDRNLGAAGARNRAIAAARGTWVATLDADDVWLPERLEALLAVARGGDADLLADDVLLHDAELRPLGETALGKRGVRLDAVTRVTLLELVRWDLGFLKPIFRRRFLADEGLRYDDSLRHGEEDFELMWRCLRRGARYDLVPAGYYRHRGRPGSLTSHRLRLFEASRATTVRFLEEVGDEDASLSAALEARLRRIDHTIAYNRCRQLLRARAPVRALRELLGTPGALTFAAGRAWRGTLGRRAPARGWRAR